MAFAGIGGKKSAFFLLSPLTKGEIYATVSLMIAEPLTQSTDLTLNQLSARHEAIMLRLLEGVTPRQVSAEFSITESRLSLLRNSEIWKQAEAKLRNDRRKSHQDKLNSLADKAILALEDTVIDTDPRVKLMSAKEILNRTGFNPAIKIEQELSGSINLYTPKHWSQAGETMVSLDSESDTD